MLFIFYFPIPIFTAKFSALSSCDGLLCLGKHYTWKANCIGFKTFMIQKVRTSSNKEN
jgi:hypothetical protein